MNRLFLHPEDRACILFHLVLCAAWMASFVIWQACHTSWTVVETAAFVAAASLLLGWCAGIDVAVNYHNHAHRPFFSSPALNLWVGRLWTVTSGWPSYFFDHSHIRVHHANLLTERDWTLPRRLADGRLETLPRYAVRHWPWRFAREFFADFAWRDPDPTVRRRGKIEFFVFCALWAPPFLYDPWMALWLWVVPQFAGNVLLSGSGMYAQHAGCVPPSTAHPFDHSNSSTNALHNLTMFNLGYHAAHHERPDIHWTALPRFHEAQVKVEPQRAGRVFRIGYYAIASGLADWFKPRDTREAALGAWSEGGAIQFDVVARGTQADVVSVVPSWRTRVEEHVLRLATHTPVRFLLRSTFPALALLILGGTPLWGPLVTITLAIVAYQTSKELF